MDHFTQGAIQAKKAGFDGIQFHVAHGYWLSRLLSPCYNRREDDYGGNIANRARIVMEVLRRIREGVGNRFPVLIK
ncbi:oxidoreductase [Desulforhabdus amnigena]|uniref:oxidoreductase n=1 Tax=Desulforhabdus amnigena TaxID=40218 RepID=UPI0016911DD8|nr:hypothetical protein [Deltaproteobacteria bacterium]